MKINLAFILAIVYFCTMDGLFRILENTSFQLICTWMYSEIWILGQHLINKRQVRSGWNGEVGGQTVQLTENLISMNLLQIFCVITWAWSFLTSEVVEAVRGQKHHISAHTLALNVRFIPQRQFCLPKIHQEMRSVMTLSLHSDSISRILEPSPQGLISSLLYVGELVLWLMALF